jgi:DNA (cytosine-5)-methyltransferase 1
MHGTSTAAFATSELTIDSFCGGGGTSIGIEWALGQSPDYAINHDPVALAMHAINHPRTRHLRSNIWKVDPDEIDGPIGLGWFSPDCTDHSKAKGGKPVRKHIRDLAWVVLRWARRHKGGPRIIIIENVEEWQDWSPVITIEGVQMRCPKRKGQTFRRFVRCLRNEGYSKIEWRELRGCNYGDPTVRKRLFFIARRDGLPIVWPEASHGPPDSLPVSHGKATPWRTAAECIDWSIPCPSIFDTAAEIKAKYGVRAVRPLAHNSLARLAFGTKRYVLEATDPFIIPITHTGGIRTHSIREPVRTLTTAHRGEHALVVPALINTRNGERPGQDPRTREVDQPYWTLTAEGSQGAVMAAFLAQHNTDMVGHDAREPVSTIVGKGCTQAVVSAGLVNLKGSDRRHSPVTAPSPTQTAGGWHIAEAEAFLLKYYGTDQDPQLREPLHTATTKDRFGLAEVTRALPPLSDAQLERAREVARFLRAHGCWDDREFVTIGPWLMIDLGMRMLTPRELFRANGAPDSYIIDRGIAVADDEERGWKAGQVIQITKTDQIRCCGNMVNPSVSCALVKANYQPMMIAPSIGDEFRLVAAE